MDALIAFYNAQHGSKKEFLFNYDGIEEHCYFAEPISVSAIRELGNVVGYEAEVKLGCTHQVAPYHGEVSVSDTLNITPKDKVTHELDWNTKMVSMISNGRQETYTEPTEKFSVTLVGTKQERDELLKLFNLHGSTPFTFRFDGRSYFVRFPDSIEITDKRSMTIIQGFESAFDLEVVKNPKNGYCYEEAPDYTSAIIVKKDLSLQNWYNNGCLIEGVSYRDNLKTGLRKLQNYRITNCRAAFKDAKGIETLPELDTAKCKDMYGMFQNSSIKIIKGLDFSLVTSVSYMFTNSVVMSFECPLDFPSLTSAGDMFHTWRGAMSIPYLKMPKVTNAFQMFQNGHFNTVEGLYMPKLQEASQMFGGSTVKYLPTLDFSNVTAATLTFDGCYDLMALDIINCNKLRSLHFFCNACRSLERVTGLDLTSADNDYRQVSTDNFCNVFTSCEKLRNLTIIEDRLISREDLKNKYYSFMVNYGLLDGRYRSRFIEHLLIVNRKGKLIERYDKNEYGEF